VDFQSTALPTELPSRRNASPSNVGWLLKQKTPNAQPAFAGLRRGKRPTPNSEYVKPQTSNIKRL
jgi:hypothetical protein